MLLLGINDNHDASCCLIKNGKIIDVIQEERITRKKEFLHYQLKQ